VGSEKRLGVSINSELVRRLIIGQFPRWSNLPDGALGWRILAGFTFSGGNVDRISEDQMRPRSERIDRDLLSCSLSLT